MERDLLLKCVKICSIVTSILTFTVAIVLITLAFTALKPRDPLVIIYYPALGLVNVTRANLTAADEVNVLRAAVVIGIENRNHGGFQFGNATGHVRYRGEAVGEFPVAGGRVGSRSAAKFDAPATIWAWKLRRNREAVEEIDGGWLNLTAEIVLEGRMSVFKVLKLAGPVYSQSRVDLDFRTTS